MPSETRERDAGAAAIADARATEETGPRRCRAGRGREMRRPRRVRRADRARHWSADVVCWVPAALRLMQSERREKGTQAPPLSRAPAPPRRRGRGGVGLAEGARCGGRVASVVDRGRGHRSAEVVLWVPAAPRRCRGSPPPRRLAIARNLSLTAALKICCKTRAHFKSWLVRRGRVCCAILPPTRRACSAQWRSQPCASQRGAAPCLPLQKRLAQPSARTRIFCAPLYSTAAGQATPWAKGSAPPQAGRARTAMS